MFRIKSYIYAIFAAMKISLVVAAGLENEIGAKGELLWHLPKDMQHFKKITMGHCVLMGRKTYDSIPQKFRPLVGRTNIVLSRQSLVLENCFCEQHLATAIELAKLKHETELMIIGGGALYAAAFEIADYIYLTRVQQRFPNADTFFPKIEDHNWIELERQEITADEKHLWKMDFLKLERRR